MEGRLREWSRKKANKRQKASRKDRNARSEKRHKTVSKKKSRRTIQRESLSSLGEIEEIEHVYLSAMTFDMLYPLLDESTDQSASEADETMIETATMSASSSIAHSSSSSGTSGESEPPKEFFDNLLEQPEHRAMIKESGITRALYLEKL